MNPVSGGWTSHKTNSSEIDYESKKRAAIAQSGQNAYTQGIQTVMEDGTGTAIQNTRTKYGNVNIMPQEVLEGKSSNFAQKDAPGSVVQNDSENVSGSMVTQRSSTNIPQEDPASFEASGLEERLKMYAEKGQGFPGLNDRSRGA
jgi:hypothetical protein